MVFLDVDVRGRYLPTDQTEIKSSGGQFERTCSLLTRSSLERRQIDGVTAPEDRSLLSFDLPEMPRPSVQRSQCQHRDLTVLSSCVGGLEGVYQLNYGRIAFCETRAG